MYALLAIAATVFVAPPAEAQQPETCGIVRAHPAGVLARCGGQMKSLVLDYEDVRRQIRNDPQGVFHFVCPIEEMCESDIRLSGWMIDHTGWSKTTQDETAIFELLRKPPIILRAGAQRAEPSREPPKSTCGVFDIEIATLPAKAVCYDIGENRSTTIVVVAASHEIGFVLLFNQHNIEWQALREKVQNAVPRFKLERATGDSELLRWVR